MKRFFVCLLILLLALSLAACAKTENAKGIILEADILNEVNLGDELRIVVKENRTTQYRWYFDVSGDDILEVASDDYVLDRNLTDRGGSGGARIITFLTVSSGEATIRMYLMPEMPEMPESYDYDEDGSVAERASYPIAVNERTF